MNNQIIVVGSGFLHSAEPNGSRCGHQRQSCGAQRQRNDMRPRAAAGAVANGRSAAVNGRRKINRLMSA